MCHLLLGWAAADASGEDMDGFLDVPPDQSVTPGAVVGGDQRGRSHPDDERHFGDDLVSLVVSTVDQRVEQIEDHWLRHASMLPTSSRSAGHFGRNSDCDAAWSHIGHRVTSGWVGSVLSMTTSAQVSGAASSR
jgi:hypothetical protein